MKQAGHREATEPRALRVKLLDFISINPSAIRNLFFDSSEQRLYVARKDCSEVYQLGSHESISMQMICRLPACEYLLKINEYTAMFLPFEGRVFRNGKWERHCFTTQLLSVRVHGDTLYSFHEKESLCWSFKKFEFCYKHLSGQATPYHISHQNCLEGLGKKVVPPKGALFTCCEVVESKQVFVGDSQGRLHIYDWKFLTLSKTFSCHEASILSIKVNQSMGTVYWSGCDSKVLCAKESGREWHLTQDARGQSHDVMSLELYGDYLMAGGLTTDVCFYSLSNGQITKQFINKVSYSSERCTASQGRYLAVNKLNSFEIWKIGSNREQVKLIVQYTFPHGKRIKDLRMSKQLTEDSSYLLMIVTEDDIVGWKFTEECGLAKFITIHGVYDKIEFFEGKTILLALRADNLISKIYCKTGKIEEMFYSQIEIPNIMKILPGKRLLLASSLNNSVALYDLVQKESIFEHHFARTVTYLDQLCKDALLVKYFGDESLHRLSIDTSLSEPILNLPVTSIRFGGWFGHKGKDAFALKYWFGVSEGKIVIVSRLGKEGKKKIRVRQTQRIREVVTFPNRSLENKIAVVPYNFSRMVDEMEVKPVFTKKIF